jgi:RimJ/RimL family protein N-acetyltransferase
LRLPRQDNPQDLELLEKALETKLPTPNKTLNYCNDNGFAIIGFANLYETDVELFIYASGKWCNRELLKHAFTYIFYGLGVKRCTCRVLNKNHKAIKLITKLGFIKEGELRGLDTGLYSLLKNECKYYEQKEPS